MGALEEETAWQRLGATPGQCVDGEHCSLAELSSRRVGNGTWLGWEGSSKPSEGGAG